LTPAGKQFCSKLSRLFNDLNEAIEQAQNISQRYSDEISIAMMVRSAIPWLPKVIEIFNKEYPHISIRPLFSYENSMEIFLQGQADIVFAMDHEIKRIPQIVVHKFYDSLFYVICNKDDKLAVNPFVQEIDLKNVTLMVGGGSPPLLKNLQQQLIKKLGISYFNSPDHDTTITNILARKGICIAPGFLNDGSDMLDWIPFNTKQVLSCVLCVHEKDKRQEVKRFIELLQTYKAGVL